VRALLRLSKARWAVVKLGPCIQGVAAADVRIGYDQLHATTSRELGIAWCRGNPEWMNGLEKEESVTKGGAK